MISKAIGELKSTGTSSAPAAVLSAGHPSKKLPTRAAVKDGVVNTTKTSPANSSAAAVATTKYITPKGPTGAFQSVTIKPSKPTPKLSTKAPAAVAQPKEGASFIDEIINESNDLLQAAREAQSLGRLRASSSYLLLAHARLVGLGRRFDRSRCLEDETASSDKNNSNAPMVQTELENSNGDGDNSNSNVTILQPPQANDQTAILPPMPVAHNALPEISLIENLARSSMELHHKRTGRGMQHEAQMEKMAHIPVKAGKSSANNNSVAAKDEDTPNKRKGGRGKKPPTLVMHTLLGAELDAKKLMSINPNV